MPEISLWKVYQKINHEFIALAISNNLKSINPIERKNFIII